MPDVPGEEPVAREELVELYKVAVEEYRFQVTLNWDRAKYLLGFNTAVITVATGLVKIRGSAGEALVAGIFLVGFLSAVLSAAAAYLQHGYYQSTRDHMTALGLRLTLGTAAIATTPGARRERRRLVDRLGKVQTVLYTLLAVCAAVDALGFFYVLLA